MGIEVIIRETVSLKDWLRNQDTLEIVSLKDDKSIDPSKIVYKSDSKRFEGISQVRNL